MATTTSIRVNVLGLREFAGWMGEMHQRAYDRSQRKAVTFLAKDYIRFKKAKIGSDIDRPMAFTRRAYDWDGSPRTGDIFSRAFVRGKQSDYLEIVEEGGTRRTVGNKGPLYPKRSVADRFGGLGGKRAIKDRFLNRGSTPSGFSPSGQPRYKTGDRRYVLLRLSSGGETLHGLFEKRKMGKATTRSRLAAGKSAWRTRLIVRFRQTAVYQPQLNFRKDARTYARSRFPMLSLRLFNEELARARRT